MTLTFKRPQDLNFIQSRATVDFTTVDEYAQMMREGISFDPVQALQDEDGTIWVWDGYHRGEAARKAGIGLAVKLEYGSRQAAEWMALAANHKHGLRRNNADKQRVIDLALKHPLGVSLSDSQIAKHCGVSDKTVARVRRELEATSEIPKSDIRTGADGRQINTARIGSRESGPNYTHVARLEGEIRAYLVSRGLSSLAQRIVLLSEIKERTPGGKEAYSRLLEDASLTKPFRPGDVWAACMNLLEQARQVQQAESPFRVENQFHVEQIVQRDEPDEAGQFTCPRCQQRTVRFNGKTLCLNPACASAWPTRQDYLKEMDSQAEVMGLTTDFSDQTNADIERDLASLEADGYGNSVMAIRMRAELAVRADRVIASASRRELSETVITATGSRPEPPPVIDKEHRGWLKAAFAETVNRLREEQYALFAMDLEGLLRKYGGDPKFPRRLE